MGMSLDGSHDGARHAAGFVDIHCHILPGIDDGARDRAEAVEMVRIAYSQDTTTIVTNTPQLPAFSPIRTGGVAASRRTAESSRSGAQSERHVAFGSGDSHYESPEGTA